MNWLGCCQSLREKKKNNKRAGARQKWKTPSRLLRRLCQRPRLLLNSSFRHPLSYSSPRFFSFSSASRLPPRLDTLLYLASLFSLRWPFSNSSIFLPSSHSQSSMSRLTPFLSMLSAWSMGVTSATPTLKLLRSVVNHTLPRSVDLARLVLHRASQSPPLTIPTLHRHLTSRSPHLLPPLLNRLQLMLPLLLVTPRLCMLGPIRNNLALVISSLIRHGCVYTPSVSDSFSKTLSVQGLQLAVVQISGY